MVLIETLILSRNGRTLLSTALRANLAKITAVALAIYLVVRFQDMLARGAYHEMTTMTYHSIAFWAEILIGFVIPFILLMFDRIRTSRRGLYVASLMVLAGFALNRMNTAITGLEDWPARTYFPSVIEVLITVGIAAIGFTAFTLIARFLPIFEPEASAPKH
jgi:Ni/Fe-hydrogenase subunit HybB-like protein